MNKHIEHWLEQHRKEEVNLLACAASIEARPLRTDRDDEENGLSRQASRMTRLTRLLASSICAST